MHEEEKNSRRSRPHSQQRPKKQPFDTLPLYKYNRATDKAVGKDSTDDSILEQIQEFKNRGYPQIRFSFFLESHKEALDQACS